MTNPYPPDLNRTTCRPLCVGSLVAVCILHVGCGDSPGKAPAASAPATVHVLPRESQLARIELTKKAATRLGIETTRVDRRAFEGVRWMAGEVFLPSDAVRVLTAPVAARIHADSRLPPVGTNVEAGQLMAVVSPVLAPEAIANLRAATATAVGEVERAQVRLEIATTQRDRTQRLLDQGATSVRLRDEAAAEHASAVAGLAAAKSARDVLQAAVSAGQGSASEIEILAPFSGGVRRVEVTGGQTVPPGAVLIEVVDLEAMQVRVPLHVGKAVGVDPTASASLRLGDQLVQLEPAVAPPSADPLAATVDLFYRVAEVPGGLRPGQRLEVGLQAGSRRPWLVVPWSSVVFDAYGGAWVYQQVGQETFERRRVDVARVVPGPGRAQALLARGPEVGVDVVSAGAAELFGVEFAGFK